MEIKLEDVFKIIGEERNSNEMAESAMSDEEYKVKVVGLMPAGDKTKEL